IAKSKYSLSGSLLPGRKNFKLDRKKFVMIDKTIKSYAESNEIYKKAKDEGILTKGNEGYIPGGIF
ncbi:MAG: hypothetical protein MJZ16_07480, partial [Bacteroidales bacterium]|nr:hypothetical protein [Bacteroidales bacterium]